MHFLLPFLSLIICIFVKDAAELLYDVLFESGNAVPVLIACNKQDIGHAKSHSVRAGGGIVIQANASPFLPHC